MRYGSVARPHPHVCHQRTVPGPTRSHLSFGLRHELPFSFVVDERSRVITVRPSTVLRVGIVALILAALGVGIAVGFAVGSRSSAPTAKSTLVGRSTTTAHGSTTTATSAPSATTTVAPVPVVLSCGPGSTQTVRPSGLTVGCATGAITVTAITWQMWNARTGGQGRGTLSVNSCQPNCASGTSRTVSAIVVVFDAVKGVFQDVSITPSQDASTTTTTIVTIPTTTVPTITPTTIPTITPTTSALTPVAASQPGSGWGGD
jgi:hypothetical protein